MDYVRMVDTLKRILTTAAMVVAMLMLAASWAYGVVAQNLGRYDRHVDTLIAADCRACHGLSLADRHHAVYSGCSMCHQVAADGTITSIERDCRASGCHATPSSPHHVKDWTLAGFCQGCHEPNLVTNLGMGPIGSNPASSVTPTIASCSSACHNRADSATPFAIAANQTLHHELFQNNTCEWCHDWYGYDAPIRRCENCHSSLKLHSIPPHVTQSSDCVGCHGTSNLPSYPPPTAAPVILRTPDSTGVGHPALIDGLNFGEIRNDGTDFVYLATTTGGVTTTTTATVNYWTDSQISVQAPTTAANYLITVVTRAGESNKRTLSVVPEPTVGSASPPTASTTESVQLQGTGFRFTTRKVTLYDNSGLEKAVLLRAALNIRNNEYLSFGLTNVGPGDYMAEVTTSGGPSNRVPITVVPAGPWVNTLSPTSGFGGSSLTIIGQKFGSSRGTSMVRFNGTALSSKNYASWSNTGIQIFVPYLPAGYYNVDVVTPDGTSNGQTFTILP